MHLVHPNECHVTTMYMYMYIPQSCTVTYVYVRALESVQLVYLCGYVTPYAPFQAFRVNSKCWDNW